AIASAVAAWLVLQLTDGIGEMLELPAWGGKLMLVVGFFLALFAAWAFEPRPAGMTLDTHVSAEKSITGQTGKRPNTLIMALRVVALGYSVLESRFTEWPSGSAGGRSRQRRRMHRIPRTRRPAKRTGTRRRASSPPCFPAAT
ncbi:MAG: hypothetical protein P8Y40_09940, partial [Desulfobacterales bacterium]